MGVGPRRERARDGRDEEEASHSIPRPLVVLCGPAKEVALMQVLQLALPQPSVPDRCARSCGTQITTNASSGAPSCSKRPRTSFLLGLPSALHDARVKPAPKSQRAQACLRSPVHQLRIDHIPQKRAKQQRCTSRSRGPSTRPLCPSWGCTWQGGTRSTRTKELI